MLTEQEAQSAFEELQRILRETNLGWVVDEVATEVQVGKERPKKVAVRERDAISRRASINGTFTETVEYTSVERLALLVRAVEQVTVELAKMHEVTVDLIAKAETKGRPEQHGDFSEFVFVDDAAQKRWISTPEVRGKFSSECESFTQLLKELKEYFNDSAR